MTREKAIDVILQVGMGVGPMGDWDINEPWEPKIDGHTMDEYIARAAPEYLDVFVSLIISPPDDAELLRFGNIHFLKDYPEDLFWFIAHWASRDSAAFWGKIGPLLQVPETRQSALECCSLASGSEGLSWLRPLVTDIEHLVEADQLLLIQSLWAVSGKESLVILEELKATIQFSPECHFELMNAIAHLSQWH